MRRRIWWSAGLSMVVLLVLLVCHGEQATGPWKPSTDWGHWRLGHRTDSLFLTTNRLTITFGSGAPNFEEVSRQEFEAGMAKAKEVNQRFHEQGYLVLRYMSSSINGDSLSNKDTPTKEQIRLLKFFQEGWKDYVDYIGPRPAADPRHWITVKADGSFPFYRYAPYGKETTNHFETWGCPNNPDYVRMMEGRIRAQAETGIDGSYVDWTQIAGETCYCPSCRKSFLAYLEENLPKTAAQAKYHVSDYSSIQLPRKRGEPFWMEWILFRGHSVAEFHRRLRGVARRYNPTFMISGNVFGGFGYGPIAYDAAGNIEMLGRDGYDDFIYSEIQEFLDSAPRKNEQGIKITNSPALKFLAAAAHGKPVVVYATEITPPVFPNPTEKCLSAMAQINIAEAVANHTVFREKRETPPGATQIYQFLASQEKELLGCQLTSNVAVLASLQPYLADELSFAFSQSRVLSDRGIAHTFVVEDDLVPEKLVKYDLLLLPYLPLLSVNKQQALVRYVEGGGSLLILGACGQKDQFNVPLSEIPLAKMLGASQYPEQAVSKKVKKGLVRFLPVVIPPSRFLIPMKSKGEYTTFGPTMADLFADIPEGYTRNRIDSQLRKHLEIAADDVVAMLKGRVSRLASPVPFVELTTMVAEGRSRLLLHLVNYDVTLDGTVAPSRNLSLEVALPPGRKARAVRYCGDLTTMKGTPFHPAGPGKISFVADQLGIYGLAVVEME
jgi:hypothetical protein